MKIAVISDTHDNIINLKKCLDYLNNQGINVLIHCGDISTWNTLKFLRKNFTGEIYACLGNMDIEPELMAVKAKKMKNINFYSDFGEIEIEGLPILFAHEPVNLNRYLIKNSTPVAFCGHTHKPGLEKVAQTIVINPGTLSGMFTQATFAIFDTAVKAPQLILLSQLK